MDRLRWTLPLALALAGCQTLYEEMPARPNGLPTGVVSGSPILVASPSPKASPSPSPVPTPTPTPTPTPEPTTVSPGSIAYIRVGFFDIVCKNGKAEPRNGEKLLPTGCLGFVTATPKRKDGTDVPASEHGPNIEWDLLYGERQVEVRAPTYPNAFNKDLYGLRSGGFSLCATVKGVTGCLEGKVI